MFVQFNGVPVVVGLCFPPVLVTDLPPQISVVVSVCDHWDPWAPSGDCYSQFRLALEPVFLGCR